MSMQVSVLITKEKSRSMPGDGNEFSFKSLFSCYGIDLERIIVCRQLKVTFFIVLQLV